MKKRYKDIKHFAHKILRFYKTLLSVHIKIIFAFISVPDKNRKGDTTTLGDNNQLFYQPYLDQSMEYKLMHRT